MPNIGQNMLYVISESNTMSWPAFKNVFDELVSDVAVTRGWSPDEVRRSRRSLVRGLQALGHIEVVEQDGVLGVTIAPPALVRLPLAGQATAVLTGWRSPSMLRELSQIALDRTLCVAFRDEQASPDSGIQPSRWVISARSDEQLDIVASRLGIEAALRPPAWALGAMAPSLSEYMDQLEWGPSRDVPPGALAYNCLELRFLRDDRRDAVTGLWSIPVRTTVRRRYVMRVGGRQAFAQLDFARWALLALAGKKMGFYDAKAFCLSVPSVLPLPLLVARAAALCSGRMPIPVNARSTTDRSTQITRLEYSDVPPLLGRQLLAKLALPTKFSIPTGPAGA